MVGHITVIPGPDVPSPTLGKTPFEITGSFFGGKNENYLTQRTHLDLQEYYSVKETKHVFQGNFIH